MIFRLELVTHNGHRRYHGGTCALSWYDVKVLRHTFHSSFISSCWESSLLVNIMWHLHRALRQAWYCFFMTWPLSYYFLLWWIIVISVSTNELILIVLFGCCLNLLLVCDGSRIYCWILFSFARSMRTCSGYGANLLNYFKIILILHVWRFLKLLKMGPMQNGFKLLILWDSFNVYSSQTANGQTMQTIWIIHIPVHVGKRWMRLNYKNYFFF